MVFGRKPKDVRRRSQLMEGQDDISFRRSRTMQGTTSSNVKAVNQKRAELKSERLKKQQHERRKQVYIMAVSTIVVLIVSVWYLISQYAAGVGSIDFRPTTDKSPRTELYTQAIDDYIAARPAERFVFALNIDRLTQAISSKLPEVKKIKQKGTQSNQADFEIELRKPVASWKTSNGQSFVDDNGVSFVHNYFADPKVEIIDNTGAESVQNGSKAVVSERMLRFLGRLVSIANISRLGEVKEASLPKATAREIDIKLQGRPYLIKTHIDRDPAATVEDIKRVVSYIEQKNINPKYIDVRVAGRAFYK